MALFITCWNLVSSLCMLSVLKLLQIVVKFLKKRNIAYQAIQKMLHISWLSKTCYMSGCQLAFHEMWFIYFNQMTRKSSLYLSKLIRDSKRWYYFIGITFFCINVSLCMQIFKRNKKQFVYLLRMLSYSNSVIFLGWSPLNNYI